MRIPITIAVTIDVPAQRIAEIMTMAIEGNPMTRSWCAGVSLTSNAPDYLAGETVAAWYERPSVFESDFKFQVKEILDQRKPPNSDNIKVHVVDLNKISTGIGILSKKYAHHFRDFIADNADVCTADVFLQCVALGDIIYDG
jgi:hypothetical protein